MIALSTYVQKTFSMALAISSSVAYVFTASIITGIKFRAGSEAVSVIALRASSTWL